MPVSERIKGLAASTTEIATVVVGGEEFFVKRLTTSQMKKMLDEIREQDVDDHVIVLKHTLCHEDGNLQITTDDDIKAIEELPFAYVNRICKFAQNLNGVGEDSGN